MAIITTDCTLDTLIFASVAVFGIYLYITRNSNYWKKRGVKDLRSSFFFGNGASCFFARKTPRDIVQELYDKADGEKMVGFYVFGKPYLLVRDPELIKHIFIKDFHNFSNKLSCGNEGDAMGSASVLLAMNSWWKYIRRKLTTIFTTGKLMKMYELMLQISHDFEMYLDKLDVDEKIGKPIEVEEICAKFMTDLIGTTVFGISFNSLKDPDAEFRKNGREMFRSSFKRYLQMLSIVFIPSLRTYTNPKFFGDKGTEFLKNTFGGVINERTKTGIKRADLLDLLIEIKKNQDNEDTDMFKLEGDALVAQAAIFFAAGFEPSTINTAFALHALATNPEVQTRLRDEILEGLEKTGGKLTYDLVTTLPYLDMVVQETMRRHQAIAWIDRVPETDYTFPGTDITVEKGTPLILPMRAMHMDPKYFPDPDKLDPERFSEENKKNITPFSYFPFGQGPRNCIGMRLGLMQIKLGIIQFVSEFELSPCNETQVPIKLDNLNVFTHPSDGVPLNLRKLCT